MKLADLAQAGNPRSTGGAPARHRPARSAGARGVYPGAAALSGLLAVAAASHAARPRPLRRRPPLKRPPTHCKPGMRRRRHGCSRPSRASRAPPARLWRLLGSAYQQLHDNHRAISAYRQALALEPDSPQALYGLGSAYAGAKNWPQAWHWLGRAQATHRFDMSQITEDPNLTPVNHDPRFAALLPRAADFEHPFVEPVRIIHEWRGEAANDQFGWIARNIGDVDGDGVNDVVISAPTHGAAARMPVASMSTRAVAVQRLWSADGAAGDELGTGVEAAGDTNQDGIPDVIASGPAGRGIARIYSGRDGRVLQEFHAESPDEMFGNHSAGAGDVDGDGCADVIVGSPGKDGRVEDSRPRLRVLGPHGRATADAQRGASGAISSAARWRASPTGSQRYLIVGAPLAGTARHGRVYVYAGPTLRAQVHHRG